VSLVRAGPADVELELRLRAPITSASQASLTASTMSTTQAISFSDVNLNLELERCSNEDLDGLDFGVIGIDAAGLVQRYNSFESKAAGLSSQRVLGHPLFTVVAPCMNNFMVAQRFEDALASGSPLDSVVDYVLTLRMRPVKVKLRLIAAPEGVTRYVLVQRPA
jgi:photoactive yellow protein